MNTREIFRLALIVLAGIQSWNAVLCSRTGTRDQFLNWLQTHSNNENAVYEYTHPNSVTRDILNRKALIAQLIPILIKELEQYRYSLDDSRNSIPATSNTDNKKLFAKRNYSWQPMGGPLPVETRLVAFGSRLGPGTGDDSGSQRKTMRYGKKR